MKLEPAVTEGICVVPCVVVADYHIAVHLAAEIAVVLYTAHAVTVCHTGSIEVVPEALLSPFVCQTALYIKPVDDVILDGTAESIAVAVHYRLFAVEYPVRILELLHGSVSPVVDIDTPGSVIHLVIVLVVVPVLASREQVGTRKRIEKEAGSSLVFNVLVCIFCIEVKMHFLEDSEIHLGIEVMAHIVVLRSYTL